MRDIIHACSMFRVRIPTAKGTLYNIQGGPTISWWFVSLDRFRWISRDTIEKADMESRNRNSFCWKLILISYIGWTRGSVQWFTTRIPKLYPGSVLSAQLRGSQSRSHHRNKDQTSHCDNQDVKIISASQPARDSIMLYLLQHIRLILLLPLPILWECYATRSLQLSNDCALSELTAIH